MHYQPHNCTFFDWHCEIKLILFLACLLNINRSSVQLIKKGPTVYHMCPTLIMFTNHTHPPKPKSDPKDMCMRFSNLYLLHTHHHLLFFAPDITECFFFPCVRLYKESSHPHSFSFLFYSLLWVIVTQSSGATCFTPTSPCYTTMCSWRYARRTASDLTRRLTLKFGSLTVSFISCLTTWFI